MIYKDIICGKCLPTEFDINGNELRARLGNSIDYPQINDLISEYNASASYKYAYIEIPVKVDDEFVEFDFAKVKSHSLARVLANCKSVIVIALTAGMKVDRLISRKHYSSKAEAFVLDGIASAGVESFADYVTNIVCKNRNVTNRFSPGYADFSIEIQKSLLSRLDAQTTLGIVLSKDLLMIPIKSITAIIGIKD